jgi:hypothetical protein
MAALGTDRTINGAAGPSACWGEADGPGDCRISAVDPITDGAPAYGE